MRFWAGSSYRPCTMSSTSAGCRTRRPTNLRMLPRSSDHTPSVLSDTSGTPRYALAPGRARLGPADERGRHERLGAGRPALHEGVAVALQIHANVLESGVAKHSLDFGDERGARDASGVRLEIVPHGSRNLSERDDVGDRQAPARGEHTVRFAEDRGFVRREVDHAVRHDHVDALRPPRAGARSRRAGTRRSAGPSSRCSRGPS